MSMNPSGGTAGGDKTEDTLKDYGYDTEQLKGDQKCCFCLPIHCGLKFIGVCSIIFGGILAPLNFAMAITVLTGGLDSYEPS